MKKFEGKSLRKNSDIAGHDFETVKKYVDKDNFNIEFCPKQTRAGKLSVYKELVTEYSLPMVKRRFTSSDALPNGFMAGCASYFISWRSQRVAQPAGCKSKSSRRDLAVLTLLYNSGARVQ